MYAKLFGKTIMKLYLNFFLFYFFFLNGGMLQAEVSDRLTLRSLRSFSSKTFELSKMEKSLFILFQEDCSSCKRQIEEVKKISSYKVILLGSFVSEKTLRRMALSFDKNLKVYYLPKEKLNVFGLLMV